MAWRIELTPEAEKDLARLPAREALRITRFLKERIAPAPRDQGGPLKGQLREYWRWRVGNYRVLARLEDGRLLVLAVRFAHRREVYRN